ncbi:MAG TPA: CAP domain-containing protein [Kofleriaceae bacterium]|nr:CAP domain-containing protein [Kofleriaceae bacterium]
MKLALVLVASLAACGGDDGGGGGGGGGDGGGSTAAHAFCVSETNRYRTQNGKPEVAYSAELEAYANEGAMVDFFSTDAHQHFKETSGGGIAFAENECPQQGNWRVPGDGDISAVVGDCVAAFYSEGPQGGHYKNMMGPYAKLGCGIYMSDGKITIVQDYGN